jgi:hypothetical protein
MNNSLIETVNYGFIKMSIIMDILWIKSDENRHQGFTVRLTFLLAALFVVAGGRGAAGRCDRWMAK